MPAISGSQKALMYNLSGVGRAGATRAGYHSPKIFVTINGTHYATGRSDLTKSIDDGSLSITEALNQSPNTLALTARGFEPTQGQDVVVTLGSKNSLNRLFAGTILNRTHQYVDSPANYTVGVSAIDYTWGLTRRLFTGSYTSVSATTIANAIIATVPGYTSGVAAGLPTIDAISFTNTDCLSALLQLAKRLGYYCDVDYFHVVKLFLTDATVTAPTTITAASALLNDMEAFQVSYDLSQVRTRVFVEGGGGNALQARAVGATTLEVDTTGWYSASGGLVAVGSQRLSYTGLGIDYTTALGIWTQRLPPTPGSAFTYDKVLWVAALSLFVAIGVGAGSGAVMTSPDGVTWTSQTFPAAQYNSLAYAPSLGLLVAVGVSTAMSSPDGVTWTTRTTPASTWFGVTWAASLTLFVAVAGSGTNRVMTSPDGITWTARTAAAAIAWECVIWAPALTKFVAGGDGATNSIMTSPDGITWTLQTTSFGHVFGVAWSPTLALLVSVQNTGAAASSPDGITWTTRTAISAVSWFDVEWIAELSLFLAVGLQMIVGATPSTVGMVSSDGITWAGFTTPAAELTSVAWSPTLGLLVAVGIYVSATVTQLITSATTMIGKLIGIPASGAGSILYPILVGDQVNLVVQCDDAAAQTALAALLGGSDDGVVEEYLQDGRINQTEALARGAAQLALVSTTQVGITYTTHDTNTHAGRVVSVSLGSPTSVAADFRIQHVTIAQFYPALLPTYTAQASSALFSLEDLLRLTRLTREASST